LWLWVDWQAGHPHRARLALLVGCAGAAAMFVATLVSPTQLSHDGVMGAIRQHDVQPSSRLLCWEAALNTVREHPLLGEGTGLPMPCPAYLHVSGVYIHLQDAHNSFLNIAALTGLAAFLAIAVWLLARAGRWSLDSPDNIVVTTLAIAFVEAFLYQGLSSSFEHTRHLWALAGLLAAAVEVRRSPAAAS
jgi:O-antigen ligase